MEYPRKRRNLHPDFTRKEGVLNPAGLSLLRERKPHDRRLLPQSADRLDLQSNHIKGIRLTHDQMRFIFETNTIGIADQAVNVDDVVETANHFRCIDMIIDQAERPLSERFTSSFMGH